MGGPWRGERPWQRPPRLTIRDLRARPVNVPMRIPLQTSGGTVGVAPLALVDLVTEQGVTGHA
jgi:mandelate racemase